MRPEDLNKTVSRLEHLVILIDKAGSLQTKAILKSEYLSSYMNIKRYDYPLEQHLEDYALKLKEGSHGGKL